MHLGSLGMHMLFDWPIEGFFWNKKGKKAYKSINHVFLSEPLESKSHLNEENHVFLFPLPQYSTSGLNYLTTVPERDICKLEPEHKILSHAQFIFHSTRSLR